MKQLYFTVILLTIFLSCSSPKKQESTEGGLSKDLSMATPMRLNLEEANKLASLPLACIQHEYPNKLGQVIGDSQDLQEPTALHPTFYGCFDWHSAVHGHWSLIKLLKEFPEIAHAEEALQKLRTNITPKNIEAEIRYFKGKHNKSYERTYGWAWLLKLSEELHSWDTPVARELETTLQPLTDLIVERYIEFLPRLIYPIRVGEHTNTAFGLSFAWDYAVTVNNQDLQNTIAQRAKDFYQNDANCPITWEPSGYDFLSPCLEEIDLMRRVLNKLEFENWMKQFAPQLKNQDFQMPVGEVKDRTDGKLVHLDGLNFSRAWVFYGLAKQYPKDYGHLIQLGNEHIQKSLPSLVGDSYEGGHWLGSFAIYAMGNS